MISYRQADYEDFLREDGKKDLLSFHLVLHHSGNNESEIEIHPNDAEANYLHDRGASAVSEPHTEFWKYIKSRILDVAPQWLETRDGGLISGFQDRGDLKNLAKALDSSAGWEDRLSPPGKSKILFGKPEAIINHLVDKGDS